MADREPQPPPVRDQPGPANGSMTVALVSEVFFGADGPARLAARLREAREGGADLALLPELPLDPWIPATDQPADADVEPLDGPRARRMAEVAREVGIGLIGGAIVRDPVSGERRSRSMAFDAAGRLVGTYEKVHLPEEPGFWETSHYRPGDRPPDVVEGFALTLGLQVCSDINRPEGSHLLGAAGAEVILVPRATEPGTYERWQLVFRANALTSAAYVLSVNRPSPEGGVPLGGPSVAVGPDGDVLLETTDPMAFVTLERTAVRRARRDYPGYLPIRAGLYAEAWSRIARQDG
jgi:N-carbamoylputrescine amidase